MSSRLLQYKHLFFDLDGTLADTEKDLKIAWLEVIDELKIKSPDFERLFRIGPQAPDMARILFPDLDDVKLLEAVDLFMDKYENLAQDKTTPYPWMEKFLRDLKANGSKLYILTNKSRKPTLRIVENFGWQELFSGIFTPDMYEGKSYAKGELLGVKLKELSIAPESAVMVGDTSFDMNAGKENAVSTAGVLWGYAPEDVSSSGCDMLYTAKDFEQWM
jgi:phosphoglycolate phosphatase